MSQELDQAQGLLVLASLEHQTVHQALGGPGYGGTSDCRHDPVHCRIGRLPDQ